jgi:hypothetical protein
MRELDSRTNDGIHVRLLWIEADDRVMLAVEDAKTGDAFTVDVHRDDSALEAFRHPYAYAAWRGVEMSASEDRPPALPASAEPAF